MKLRHNSSPEARLIINQTRGMVVCEHCVIADHPVRRMRGLLGRRMLPAGEGLLLTPAPSIHTAFMRFPIDAVFLDAELRIVKLAERLGAWRAAGAWGARAVLELAQGEGARRGLNIGDRLDVVDGQPRPTLVGPEHAPAKGAIIREHPQSATRVLLAGTDRRFRTVASALLTRRGYSLTVTQRPDRIAEIVAVQHVDVVVIDAGPSLTTVARELARVQAVDPPVGVVVVGDQRDGGLSSLPVLAKWDSFFALFDAIDEARRDAGKTMRCRRAQA